MQSEDLATAGAGRLLVAIRSGSTLRATGMGSLAPSCRAPRRLWIARSAGVAAFVVLMTLAFAALTNRAYAAGPQGLTQIATPTPNQVVGAGGVRVVLRSSASLARLRVSVDGRNVKRYFQRSDGAYRARLALGRGLHLGVDQLTVVTGVNRDVDRVTFIVARRVRKLVTLTQLRIGGKEAPVRVVVRTAPGSTLQAWVNGHRDAGAFQPQDGVYVGRLGANDWLRPGRNRLVVLAYRTSTSGRSAVYNLSARTFWDRPGRLTAAAGQDRIVNGGDFIRLHGSASDVGLGASGPPAVTYQWTIIDQPAGTPATLEDPSSATPGFEATAPGDYLVRTRTTAANGASSDDTASVTVRADLPPIGTRLDTVADDRGTIKLDGTPVPNTTEQCDPGADGRGCAGHASYAVFNRQTLELVTSGNVTGNGPGSQQLVDLATQYNAAPTYLMVVNLQGYFPEGAGRKLLETLGVAKMTDADLTKTLASFVPVSIVGVPGSPAGSAFISNAFLNRLPPYLRTAANMSGYLRLNPLSTTGDFEFVFTDQVEFNTDASAAPSQITMKVGDRTYAHDAPTDGSSGFFLVRLNSQTLAPDHDFFYVTNKPDGSEIPAEAKRMADDIAWATSPGNNNRGELLVMLQAFGKPKGTSAGWLQAAQAIENLGGNAQVFAQLNQGASDEPHQGRYAFTARSAMDAAAAESSQSLTGQAGDGKLHGLLGRGRDDQYEPLLADPTGAVNFDLVKIVNRPSPSGGGFPVFTGGQAAAASFLGRDPDIIGVCDRSAPTCDVRKAYYENYVGTNWGNILSRLGSDATRAKCAQGGPGFTATDCNAVRQEFELEIGRRNTVEEYFGPKGLQAPFGTAQVAALVDVAKVAEAIKTAIQPPAADNAASHALSIISFITKIGGLAGAVFPPAGAVASGLGAAFGLAAYLTHHDGSPDVVGPQVTAAAANLGSDLFGRYQRVSSYFTTESKIIMSDWSKLSEVAAVATSNPKWILGDIATSTETIRLATTQAIYQALFSVAYPFLYDLGTGVTHATNWRCIGTGFTYNKNLFQHTGTGAELTYRMTDPRYLGQTHVLAIGARHTVDNLHSAYIPAPPDSLTGPMFRDPAAPQGGGIGLFKLNFYSPQNFHVFPKVLQQSDRGDGYGYNYCQSMPDPPGNSG